MESLLSQAKEITNSQYLELKDPQFIGQSFLDLNNMYWMVFEDEGVLYKTHNQLMD